MFVILLVGKMLVFEFVSIVRFDMVSCSSIDSVCVFLLMNFSM